MPNKRVPPRQDKELNMRGRKLERETIRTRPAHKHKRYSRIENHKAFGEGIERIFGVRDPDYYQKRAKRLPRKEFKLKKTK